MIVRISSEGQYRIGSATLDRVNDIDRELVSAVAGNDEAAFCRYLQEMVDVVRLEGQPVPPEQIVESDLVLPPPDTSLEEARALCAALAESQ